MVVLGRVLEGTAVERGERVLEGTKGERVLLDGAVGGRVVEGERAGAVLEDTAVERVVEAVRWGAVLEGDRVVISVVVVDIKFRWRACSPSAGVGAGERPDVGTSEGPSAGACAGTTDRGRVWVRAVTVRGCEITFPLLTELPLGPEVLTELIVGLAANPKPNFFG